MADERDPFSAKHGGRVFSFTSGPLGLRGALGRSADLDQSGISRGAIDPRFCFGFFESDFFVPSFGSEPMASHSKVYGS